MIRGLFAIVIAAALLGTCAGAAAADDTSLHIKWTAFQAQNKKTDAALERSLARLDKVKSPGEIRGIIRSAVALVRRGIRDTEAARAGFVADKASSATGARARSFSITTADATLRTLRPLPKFLVRISRALELAEKGKEEAAFRRLDRAVEALEGLDRSAEQAEKYTKKASALHKQAARERAAAPAG